MKYGFLRNEKEAWGGGGGRQFCNFLVNTGNKDQQASLNCFFCFCLRLITQRTQSPPSPALLKISDTKSDKCRLCGSAGDN